MTPAEESAAALALADVAATDPRISPVARLITAAWLEAHARRITEGDA